MMAIGHGGLLKGMLIDPVVGAAVCISRKDDKDGDLWFSITGKYSEVTILPQEGAAVAYN